MTTPSRTPSDNRFAPIKASAKVNPSDSVPSSPPKSPTSATNVSSLNCLYQLHTLAQPQYHFKVLIAHSFPCLSATSNVGTTGGSMDKLLNYNSAINRRLSLSDSQNSVGERGRDLYFS